MASTLYIDQWPPIAGKSTRTIFMMAGPSTTMNMLGKIKKMRGNSSFTGNLAANSSALSRRVVRIESA